MRRAKINVQIRDYPTDNETRIVQYIGWTRAGLGLHINPGHHKGYSLHMYSVTHLASGSAIRPQKHIRNRAAGVDWMKHLLGLGIDWSQPRADVLQHAETIKGAASLWTPPKD